MAPTAWRASGVSGGDRAKDAADRSVTQIAERVGLVVEGRVTLDAIAVGSPGAEVNQAAALGTERPLRALRPPDNGRAAGGAFDDAGFGGITHRLQKVILKNNINYCFL